MNRISTTTSRTRLQAVSAAALVALTALTGAAWMTISAPESGPAVIQLERVVIEGTRTNTAEVQQLPRVVVVGRRDAAADGAQVASACVAPAAC
jgi:hypothetical protein